MHADEILFDLLLLTVCLARERVGFHAYFVCLKVIASRLLACELLIYNNKWESDCGGLACSIAQHLRARALRFAFQYVDERENAAENRVYFGLLRLYALGGIICVEMET